VQTIGIINRLRALPEGGQRLLLLLNKFATSDSDTVQTAGKTILQYMISEEPIPEECIEGLKFHNVSLSDIEALSDIYKDLINDDKVVAGLLWVQMFGGKLVDSITVDPTGIPADQMLATYSYLGMAVQEQHGTVTRSDTPMHLIDPKSTYQGRDRQIQPPKFFPVDPQPRYTGKKR